MSLVLVLVSFSVLSRDVGIASCSGPIDRRDPASGSDRASHTMTGFCPEVMPLEGLASPSGKY